MRAELRMDRFIHEGIVTMIATLSCARARWIRLAIEAARGDRHGAVLVSGGRMMSIGTSRNAFCSWAMRCRPHGTGIATRHAEIECVRGVPKSISTGCVMYVAKVSTTGIIGFSRPCVMCAAVLRRAGIRRVICTVGPDSVEEIRLDRG